MCKKYTLNFTECVWMMIRALTQACAVYRCQWQYTNHKVSMLFHLIYRFSMRRENKTGVGRWAQTAYQQYGWYSINSILWTIFDEIQNFTLIKVFIERKMNIPRKSMISVIFQCLMNYEPAISGSKKFDRKWKLLSAASWRREGTLLKKKFELKINTKGAKPWLQLFRKTNAKRYVFAEWIYWGWISITTKYLGFLFFTCIIRGEKNE